MCDCWLHDHTKMYIHMGKFLLLQVISSRADWGDFAISWEYLKIFGVDLAYSLYYYIIMKSQFHDVSIPVVIKYSMRENSYPWLDRCIFSSHELFRSDFVHHLFDIITSHNPLEILPSISCCGYGKWNACWLEFQDGHYILLGDIIMGPPQVLLSHLAWEAQYVRCSASGLWP